MGITRELVEFCASVKYENLSPEIIDRVKYHCLDFLGVASRGSLTESSKSSILSPAFHFRLITAYPFSIFAVIDEPFTEIEDIPSESGIPV